MGGAGIERVVFHGSPRPTIGVEWEIALVDKVTRDLSNTAAAVFDSVGVQRGPPGPPPGTKEKQRHTREKLTRGPNTHGAAVGRCWNMSARLLSYPVSVPDHIGVDGDSASRCGYVSSSEFRIGKTLSWCDTPTCTCTPQISICLPHHWVRSISSS